MHVVPHHLCVLAALAALATVRVPRIPLKAARSSDKAESPVDGFTRHSPLWWRRVLSPLVRPALLLTPNMDHDIYLVAGLADSKGRRNYRAVAAFRSSAGLLAGRTAWRLLVLLRNPFNAQVVASELKGISAGLEATHLEKAKARAKEMEEEHGHEARYKPPTAPYLAGLVLSGYRLSETTGFPRFLEVLNGAPEPHSNVGVALSLGGNRLTFCCRPQRSST